MHQAKNVEDMCLAQQCLSGDVAAIERFREQTYLIIINRLIYAGATSTEASDIVADLWSELFMQRSGGAPPLLKSYSGRASIISWLFRVARNRFIDLKRRDKFRGDMPEQEQATNQICLDTRDELDLEKLLRDAMLSAFAECDPEWMVMLRLVYVHGISQRNVAQAWQWSESKVSRTLGKALKHLRQSILSKIAAIDPGITIMWSDVLQICDREGAETW